MPPKKMKIEKDEVEYKKRRDRNNVAVRKSREKARQKQQETNLKVQELRDENDRLEQKVTILNKELSVLKDLFLSQPYDYVGPSVGSNGPFQNGTSNGSFQNGTVENQMNVKEEVVVEEEIVTTDEAADDDPETPVNTHALWKDHEYSMPSVSHSKS